MTKQAVSALASVRADLDNLLGGLTEDEWDAASACAGWRVRDVVSHIAASARELIDPFPTPPGEPPMPENRERQHDVHVARRTGWPIAEIVAEYHKYVPQAGGLVGGMQEEPTASRQQELAGLGTYPLHALANALVFDYHCHLRYDILRPAGPVVRDLPAADNATVYAATQWMIWGLPQMQGHDLDDTVTAPITLRLTGPGESVWTVRRATDPVGLVVTEDGGGDVVVTASAESFVSWGTKRSDWRDHCSLDGAEELVAPFLDALNIV